MHSTKTHLKTLHPGTKGAHFVVIAWPTELKPVRPMFLLLLCSDGSGGEVVVIGSAVVELQRILVYINLTRRTW